MKKKNSKKALYRLEQEIHALDIRVKNISQLISKMDTRITNLLHSLELTDTVLQETVEYLNHANTAKGHPFFGNRYKGTPRDPNPNKQ